MSDIPTNTPKRFNLSEWAIGHQSIVIFLMLAIMLAGAMSYFNLSRNEDPPFTIKTMAISATWPGATPEEMSNLVANTLEKELQRTPYVDSVESTTTAGETSIFVNLADSAPPSEVPGVWEWVRKKMTDLQPSLPEGVYGPFLNDEFDNTYGIIYGFKTEGLSVDQTRRQLESVRDALLEIKHAGRIELIGLQTEEIAIEFSPKVLAARNFNLDEVLASLQAQNAVAPAGVIRTAGDKVALQVSGAYLSERSIEDTVLRIGERVVPLRDIATVTRQAKEAGAPLYRVNGEEAVGLGISMAKGGNLLEFGEHVKAKIAEMSEDMPIGFEPVLVADQALVVEQAVSKFMTVLIEAVAIVLGVSFLSLGTRAGLVVTVSIPIVLAMTFIGMDLAGIGLQRISLGALIIALGLLVDDAMITVEAMVSRLEHGWTKRKAATYAFETTALPMLTGTLVMIAGFIPVGFAASSAGEYCYSLFMVILISLSASWIVAVLFSPLLGIWLLSSKVKPHSGKQGWMGRTYSWMLDWALGHRIAVIALAVVAFGISVVGFGRLEQQFFPSADRPEIIVSMRLPQNASLEATNVQAHRLEEILAQEEGVESFSTYVGTGAIRFYLPMDIAGAADNVTETVVVAKSLEDRDALLGRLNDVFAKEFPDLVARAAALELGPPVGWPLKLRVTGPDSEAIYETALQLADIIAQQPGVGEMNLTGGEPQRVVRIQIDQTKARQLGLSSQDVANVLATVYSGAPLTTVRLHDQMIDVVVRATADERSDPSSILDLQLSSPSGRSIPLRQIATLENTVEQPTVQRRNREAMITLQADVLAGQNAENVAANLVPAVDAFNAELPPGYEVKLGGAAESSAEGTDSLLSVMPLMIFVMMTLLMIQLRSFSRMGLAIFMAPFGLIGVVVAIMISGRPMGFVAILGIIALVGMIIRNAVILIEEVDQNLKGGMERDEAIRTAAHHRARPILLTALAAILGMIPIAPQVFWGAMAFSIIGGLVVATLLTLTLLPACLSLLIGWEQRKQAPAEPTPPALEVVSA